MGDLYVVATPIGNLQDFSPRAVETLRRCRLILAEDTRHSRKLLDAFDIATPMVSYHQFNEKKRAEEVVARLLTDEGDVALISDAGTPCISDPGYHLVRLARQRGIQVYGVSGPSAVTTALSISGIPCDQFVFWGFAPWSGSRLAQFLTQLEQHASLTHVMYESPKRILQLIEAIARSWPDAAVCVCSELTKVHEKSLAGQASQVLLKLRDDPYVSKGEYTVVLRLPDQLSVDPIGSDDDLTVEARIVDYMIKDGVSLKEAIARIVAKGGASRNEAYAAGIRLKSLFHGEKPS